MKCPKCQTENPETNKFCSECGMKLILTCDRCESPILPGDRYCGNCGQKIDRLLLSKSRVSGTKSERKHITVLFSDLSGYTAITENVDAEEVREIMGRIFDNIFRIISKYEGYVERVIGDEVMALFGVPQVLEDGAVRAVKVALEIHEIVEAMSPMFEGKIGRPLSMHTGINTGMVVTGESGPGKDAYGVTGDTVNTASRLADVAESGEILVGEETYRQTHAFFSFETLEPVMVKGKAESVQAYRVLSAKERPSKIRRTSGLRAELVARSSEMSLLETAVACLQKGKGSVFSICGELGTGKSRLVEEFRTNLVPAGVQWLEGHAYPYSRNIPYFPLVDLLSRALQIEEGAPPEKVRTRIETGVKTLIGEKNEITPYLGSLYALSYPEIEDVSPEFWKIHLQEAVHEVLSAFAQKAPTIVCLEDLHWADPSSLSLIRSLVLKHRCPTIFLCVYRPPFSLFSGLELSGMGKLHQEVTLQHLSPSESQEMVESMLNTREIPMELRQFIQKKVEGNPFYLEEVTNSLIDAGILVQESGSWKLTRPLIDSHIPSTVTGVISARLDLLERETKLILQDASVIGRAFLYDILSRITELGEHVDPSISILERLDLIRTRSLQPDLEFVFKHAVTQEVVYSGLLKKERQEIHERVGRVMEMLFHERLSEFFETLAFHFKQGTSLRKAVDYLLKSGEKSLQKYAVEESHQYYQEAFDLVTQAPELETADEALIDILINWAFVYYYRGDYKGLLDLLMAHKNKAESLPDRSGLGMYYAWIGCGLWHRERFQEAYNFLIMALDIGEEFKDSRTVGYASTWLAWTCTELGLLDEAIVFADKAQGISSSGHADHYIFFNSLAGKGYAHWHRGDKRKTAEAGKLLIKFGRKHSELRSLVLGYCCIGFGQIIAGDIASATACFQKAVRISADPWYSQFSKLALCYGKVFSDNVEQAETELNEIIAFSREYGAEFVGVPAQCFLGLGLVNRGDFIGGLRILEEKQDEWLKNGSKLRQATFQYIQAEIYAQIAQQKAKLVISHAPKNVGLLLRKIPFAGQTAEECFRSATDMAGGIGARWLQGRAYLDWGFFHRGRKRRAEAGKCFSSALDLFKQCEAEVYIKETQEALLST